MVKNKKVIDGFITNKVSIESNLQNKISIESNLQNTVLKGIGIKNIIFNDDSSFTIILTDGTEYTTEPLKGDIGITPNIRIGIVQTTAPGTYASVTVQGTPEEPILNFKIPRGAVGEKGDTGTVPNISIGTVENLSPDRYSYVTRTGPDQAPIFHFGLVRGQTGQPGPQGQKGDKGDIGRQGYSAYEIAVQHGFIGTEEEWLISLGVEQATDTKYGVMKLYDETGQNIDGTMTQRSITNAIVDNSAEGIPTDDLLEILT